MTWVSYWIIMITVQAQIQLLHQMRSGQMSFTASLLEPIHQLPCDSTCRILKVLWHPALFTSRSLPSGPNQFVNVRSPAFHFQWVQVAHQRRCGSGWAPGRQLSCQSLQQHKCKDQTGYFHITTVHRMCHPKHSRSVIQRLENIHFLLPLTAGGTYQSEHKPSGPACCGPQVWRTSAQVLACCTWPAWCC